MYYSCKLLRDWNETHKVYNCYVFGSDYDDEIAMLEHIGAGYYQGAGSYLPVIEPLFPGWLVTGTTLEEVVLNAVLL